MLEPWEYDDNVGTREDKSRRSKSEAQVFAGESVEQYSLDCLCCSNKFRSPSLELPPKSPKFIHWILCPFGLHLVLNNGQAVGKVRGNRTIVICWRALSIQWPILKVDNPPARCLI